MLHLYSSGQVVVCAVYTYEREQARPTVPHTYDQL
jgi:hypothetical protein